MLGSIFKIVTVATDIAARKALEPIKQTTQVVEDCCDLAASVLSIFTDD